MVKCQLPAIKVYQANLLLVDNLGVLHIDKHLTLPTEVCERIIDYVAERHPALYE